MLSFPRGSGSMRFEVEWDPPVPGRVYMLFSGQFLQYYRGEATQNIFIILSPQT